MRIQCPTHQLMSHRLNLFEIIIVNSILPEFMGHHCPVLVIIQLSPFQ